MSNLFVNPTQPQEGIPTTLYDMEHISRRLQEQADHNRIVAESDQWFPPLDIDVPASSPSISPLASPTRMTQAQAMTAWYEQRHDMYERRDIWEELGWQSAMRERHGGVSGRYGPRRPFTLTAAGPSRVDADSQQFDIHEDVDASLSGRLNGLDIAATSREGGEASPRRDNQQLGPARLYRDRGFGAYRSSAAYRPRSAIRSPRSPRNSLEALTTLSREVIRIRDRRPRDARWAYLAMRRRQYEAGDYRARNVEADNDGLNGSEIEMEDDVDGLS